jgi:hypothetical protein
MADLNDEKPLTPIQEATRKRQETRTGEDYLRPLIKSSQFIDNLVVVLETAVKEVKDGSTYKRATENSRNNQRNNEEQSAALEFVRNATATASGLRNGLENAIKLATGSHGKLSSDKIDSITGMSYHADMATTLLGTVAAERPTVNNGLTEETTINAQATLDVIKSKLTVLVENRDGRMSNAVEAYNDSYAKRMAKALTDRPDGKFETDFASRLKKKPESLGEGAELKSGGRVEGHKKRVASVVNAYATESRNREEVRTGTGSFREALAAAANAPKGESREV